MFFKIQYAIKPMRKPHVYTYMTKDNAASDQDQHCLQASVSMMSCVCHAFASVHCCLVVTCWERVDLLAFVCGV